MATEKYRLKIMPRAADDLRNIYEYIAHELSAPKAAHSLMTQLESSFMRLRELPESCPMCQDDTLFQKGYRKLTVDNFIALYKTNKQEKTVTVMRVVHGRQEYARFV
jgi:addiction module RelE/StbE family toxin